jgi:NAD(P)H-nitrite reductase large subunit
MKLDDEICCCCHVSLRKLLNYAQRERPQHASQLSDCLGAGTGCGWCIPILQRIQAAVADGDAVAVAGDESPSTTGTVIELPDTAGEYTASRQSYIKSGQKNKF